MDLENTQKTLRNASKTPKNANPPSWDFHEKKTDAPLPGASDSPCPPLSRKNKNIRHVHQVILFGKTQENQDLNTNFFLKLFGHRRDVPAKSRRGTYRTFWIPPIHVKDPHPTRKYPNSKVWVWVSFFVPDENRTHHHSTKPRQGRRALLNHFAPEIGGFSLEKVGEFRLNPGPRTKFANLPDFVMQW